MRLLLVPLLLLAACHQQAPADDLAVDSITSDGAGGLAVCVDYYAPNTSAPTALGMSVDASGHQVGPATQGGCMVSHKGGDPMITLHDGSVVTALNLNSSESTISLVDTTGRTRWSHTTPHAETDVLYTDGKDLYAGISIVLGATSISKLSPDDGSTIWQAVLHR